MTCTLQIELGVLGHLPNSAEQTCMSDDRELITSLDDFLASVEKRAFIMARASTGNEDAALDIVQDSMFRMVKSYSKRPCEQWPPLFFRIVNNRITDHHRKRGFDRMLRWFGGTGDEEGVVQEAVDRLPTGTGSPDEQAQEDQFGSALQAALQQLSGRQRQAFMLREWHGLSVEETAVAMGVSQGSVKTHLWRAIQALQVILQEYEIR